MIKLPAGFKKNPKRMKILIALISLITLVVYFRLILIPHIRSAVGALFRTNKIRADLRKARADIAKIPIFMNDIAAYSQKVERYERMLPAEQEIPSLLESLAGMAKSSNIKIVGITPIVKNADRHPGQAYKEIPILINAKCGYHELGTFLSKLENSDRFMKVAQIEIKSNMEKLKRHDVELLILTYTLLVGGK